MSGASVRAYQIIRDAIVAGSYPGGTRLREEDLAARIKVSRTPIREAIRRLAAEGFVKIEPHVGAVVTTWDLEQVEQLFGIRAVLEGYGASLAATRARPRDIAELASMCDDMDAIADTGGEIFLEQFSAANTAFHTCILKLSGNSRLEKIASPLMALGLIMKTYQRFSKVRIRKSCADHRDLVAALKNGNPLWAEAVMQAHILASVELYRE